METGVWIGFVFPSVMAIVFVMVVIIGRINMWWKKRAKFQEDREIFNANQLAIGRLVELYRLMLEPLPYIAEKIDARIKGLMTHIDQEAPIMRPFELHLLHPVQNDLIVLLSHATTKIHGETPVQFRSRMMAYLNGTAPKAEPKPAVESRPEPEPEREPERPPNVYDESVPRPPAESKKDDEDNMVTVSEFGTKVDSSLVDMWEKEDQ